MSNITPCLWYDDQAEEAAKFYTSIFKNSKIGKISHYTKDSAEISGKPEGSVLTVSFEIDGQPFMAMNGGPLFKFSEAISLITYCEDQKEIDDMWTKLTADGGEDSFCGWLKDKFGVSWQVVPKSLDDMMTDEDSAKAQKVMTALLKMKKIDLKKLEDAYEEK